MKTGIDDSPQPSGIKQAGNVTGMMAGTSVYKQSFHEGDNRE